ncbi:VOC family protein [Deinococcus peraridilitoris]|uniref:Glyoxalase/fosfomycin resistance/dioxygenase domain-containing protein n=1 Tax=Deinococcus peraridilitoris (strain DSM 19664 / LMG 22246 / CIP 109416 / KR-200) TaxID=937777 RepID=K9ZZ23_DEIPD|nr:VOC family protein [Deinococcus peraridilitoris]AFZ66454.1 hypothetical protein Deipe_0883 [Deinococcus peraridilitoris DSM 19664]
MPQLEHVAFKAVNLPQTEAFYHNLGAHVSWHNAAQRLFVGFSRGSRLIFDKAETAVNPSAVVYIGIELPDFQAVDQAFIRCASSSAVLGRDMRETYRSATGPYGFFVQDPDGYVVKVFKYHEVDVTEPEENRQTQF